ncbi:exosortase A [Sphingobium nicotianae]|uniref:EpsI family protein n=1 Tax=Sphingobium nicotianae TaxID=2782607 RepID=A0A9X1DBF1_9SPHN|nr:exosortase A [Sphingobium nicotianae]MBT2186940.1 EpsI family protein [Sphingobium nicotianae]
MTAPSPPRPRWQHLVLREASGWQASLARLVLLAACFTLIFHADIIGMVRVWLNSQPYSHCVFLPFIIGWLVWQRREGLARLEPRGWWPALAWLGLGALAWLLGWAAGVALFRHAGVVVMGQGLVLLALGPAVARALTFPLFYAFFMIPVGTEAEPVLQIFTARMAVRILWLVGVPAQISGIFITTPNGYFRVAEACSGTGFLIAMAAFSTLVAHLCFKSMLRRLLFIGGALLVCLLANSVRAFGIIYIAFQTSVHSAVVVDHVVYGWLFFASVIALVLALGWPFFDRSPFDIWFDPSRLQGAVENPRGLGPTLMLAALAVMLLPVGWSVAARAFATPLPPERGAPAVPGWTLDPVGLIPGWEPHFSGADRMLVYHYRDSTNRVVDLALVFFAHQEDGKELVGFGQGAAAPDGAAGWIWAEPAQAPDDARGDMLAGPQAQRRLAYTFYDVNGTLTGQSGRVKLETLKARLLGRDQRAMAIIVSTVAQREQQGDVRAAQTLADFLAALGPVEDLADRSLAIR